MTQNTFETSYRKIMFFMCYKEKGMYNFVSLSSSSWNVIFFSENFGIILLFLIHISTTVVLKMAQVVHQLKYLGIKSLGILHDLNARNIVLILYSNIDILDRNFLKGLSLRNFLLFNMIQI